MTALKKYQRLESTGLWRDDPASQRREVVVRFGEATLVLTDPRSELALSHWSLPAVERRNPGQTPALFSPGPDSAETLEIDDADMIAALATVQGAVSRATPRPGRLRTVLLGGITLGILALAVTVLPGALVRHTASVIPPAKRAEIGFAALDDLIRLTGAPCDNQLGLKALAGLSERVFGPVDTPLLYVMRDGVPLATHLPGGMILLSDRLVSQPEGPEAAAGAALTEAARAKAEDPMLPLLRHAGLVATFRLLTTGNLPEGAMAGYGEAVLRAAPVALADESLLSAFNAAQLPSTPYAYAADPSGETTLPLIEGDPFRGLSPAPLIPDGDWVALQGICQT